MKINRSRLVQIIKEELDDHEQNLLSQDSTTVGEIRAGEQELRNLKIHLEQLRLMLDSEELSLSYKGYSADQEPNFTALLSQIQRVQEAISYYEENTQIDYDDLQRR